MPDCVYMLYAEYAECWGQQRQWQEPYGMMLHHSLHWQSLAVQLETVKHSDALLGLMMSWLIIRMRHHTLRDPNMLS